MTVGSVVKVAFPFGWNVVVDDPNVAAVTVAHGALTVTAISPGDTWIEVQFSNDTRAGVQVTVQ